MELRGKLFFVWHIIYQAHTCFVAIVLLPLALYYFLSGNAQFFM